MSPALKHPCCSFLCSENSPLNFVFYISPGGLMMWLGDEEGFPTGGLYLDRVSVRSAIIWISPEFFSCQEFSLFLNSSPQFSFSALFRPKHFWFSKLYWPPESLRRPLSSPSRPHPPKVFLNPQHSELLLYFKSLVTPSCSKMTPLPLTMALDALMLCQAHCHLGEVQPMWAAFSILTFLFFFLSFPFPANVTQNQISEQGTLGGKGVWFQSTNNILRSIFWTTSLMTDMVLAFCMCSSFSFLSHLNWHPLKISLRPGFALPQYPVIVIFVAIGFESLAACFVWLHAL